MENNDRKIGIVTIVDYTNYGNRLQNLALTRLLEEQGFTVINDIVVYTKEEYVERTNGIVKKALKKSVPISVLKSRIAPEQYKMDSLMRRREMRFREFSSRNIKTVDPIICENLDEAVCILEELEIDFYIAGSDQIWNPDYVTQMYGFLPFAPEDKRFSFAASFGVDSIPDEKKEMFRAGLSGMKYISLREEKGVELIKELTGRNADLTPDPTLLLERGEWEKIAAEPDFTLNEDYICTYFLGEVPEAVRLFVKEKGLCVYNLNRKDDERLFTIDPGEFLYFIRNARFVLTDSFHAVVFSVLFHKEFYVFEREQKGVRSMFSRIDTVLAMTGLENRRSGRDKITEQELIGHWDSIDSKLAGEKEKSISRLLSAMGM